MAKKRRAKRTKPVVVGVEALDPEGMVAWTRRYVEALRVKNYSPRTLETRENYLDAFARWKQDSPTLACNTRRE